MGTEINEKDRNKVYEVSALPREYVASCSSVAGMRAFLDEEADYREVEYFQGLEQFREQELTGCRPQRAICFKTILFSVNSSKTFGL